MAAVGPRYLAMARTAAAGLRRHSPDIPVHLFTDRDSCEGPFDRVVRLTDPWHRSKIDAMLAAPFERVLFLDADVFVTADVSDVFDLLDRFDIALAHDQERNGHHAAAVWRRSFPACFPQFNSGVIAFRRTPEVLALLAAWRDAVRDHEMARDQPALRELLWESDLRIATLPPEYNLMDLSGVLIMKTSTLAPRIIHHYRIHRSSGPVPVSVEDMLGRATAVAIRGMVADDRYLTAKRVARSRNKRLLQIWMLLDVALRAMRTRAARVLAGFRGEG
jgi:hypothetical protein